ncbi:MAG: ATP-grasp domain-containing protein [Methylomonas sp.]|nr:ATP-grasp domain-containing protein [Methylomonas sp.]MBS3965134.1 ATP-grasp domain-containing protein [Methylomonas sp.]PPD19256.1 MAG: hypothetical protein CTY23_12205 [Methylomonas sp.]PPD23266.1 MAG: hypothetical protein CTY22_12200 [Methylomonas sp.]PPD28352.1 MAG: hypothetical protein CTY21_13170 [Methylomonas sp.]
MKFSNDNKLLALGQSARAVAKLAVDSGWQVVTIDVFADVDTQDLAVEAYRVRSLAVEDLRPALDEVMRRHAPTHCVYASGFEANVDALHDLSKRLIILGNSPDCLASVCDRDRFFRALADLSIPFPETGFVAPEPGLWLCKSLHSAGGMAVGWQMPLQAAASDSLYWQRYQNGVVYSAAFIAHNQGVDVMGFNRQWSVAVGDRPFVFAGAMSNVTLPPDLAHRVEGWLAALARHFGLRGLGSLDFIVDGDVCHVLELNARFSASSALYGCDVFGAHVAACVGDYAGCKVDDFPRASRVLFADGDWVIPRDLPWPDWAVDRPQPGSLIGKGLPLCSIMAAGFCEADVSERLEHAEHFIRQLFQ